MSALTSWWLAQHLSAPIRRFQEGARALASENLGVRVKAGFRVSAGLEGRRDELAVLARDFDARADKLRANRSAITAQVMKAHGGSAKATNDQDGGLEVRLSLREGTPAV